KEPERLATNRRRLAFYERYGAVPVLGTLYDELPCAAKDYYLTYLVHDGLGRRTPLRRGDARKAVFRILTRKYGMQPTDPHVIKVVRSFRDDPVRLRPPRLAKSEIADAPAARGWIRPLKVVMAERHDIHHLRTKGYVER